MSVIFEKAFCEVADEVDRSPALAVTENEVLTLKGDDYGASWEVALRAHPDGFVGSAEFTEQVATDDDVRAVTLHGQFKRRFLGALLTALEELELEAYEAARTWAAGRSEA